MQLSECMLKNTILLFILLVLYSEYSYCNTEIQHEKIVEYNKLILILNTEKKNLNTMILNTKYFDINEGYTALYIYSNIEIQSITDTNLLASMNLVSDYNKEKNESNKWSDLGAFIEIFYDRNKTQQKYICNKSLDIINTFVSSIKNTSLIEEIFKVRTVIQNTCNFVENSF